MLILASKSPTRKTLLDAVGIAFSVQTAPVDERAIESHLAVDGAGKADIALALAREKALAVSRTRPQALVIGADQTLDCEGLDLHKPDSRETARRQLQELAGRTHHLHAAAALARGGDIVWAARDSAEMTMCDFSAAELEHVLDLEGEAILGSVGGYRLEGPSVRLFSAVKGDYFTVLGLPLLALLDGLRRHGPELLGPKSFDPGTGK
ncbi:Maf family protein [Pelagibacterium sediminicola]|uniref:Maf family protein n=1 Tax=Pelagibacterium sediminicola TaxID=2248761 RepID=UPI000E316262|nr:Maf family protein [Pelagibacterium sediminicola]